ncbi:MAG: phosphatidylcholine and lysophosphatidylcholine phospholipase, partial [Pleopsidium flavum]
MSLVREERIQLVTFDGDVTLYDDGECLCSSNPVISRIIKLLSSGTKVGIVTAAGYTNAAMYYERLHGLLTAVQEAFIHGDIENPELIVIGGESNYLLRYNSSSPLLLEYIPRDQWMLEEMKLWTEEDVTELLDVAEGALRKCIANMRLQADILRKERAVGIVPIADGQKITREQLEETVLVTQQILEMSDVGKRLPFCASNGGNDIFVDIGDKSWGVLCCQRFFGGIEGSRTLHVGDQFLSAG